MSHGIEKSCQFTKFPVFLFSSPFFSSPSADPSRRSCFALTGWEAHVERTSAQEVNVQVIFIPFHVVLLIPQIGFQKSFTVSVLQSKPSFNVGILKKKLQSKHVCFTSARWDVRGSGPQCGSQLCWKSCTRWGWTLTESYWSRVGGAASWLSPCKKVMQIRIIAKRKSLIANGRAEHGQAAVTCCHLHLSGRHGCIREHSPGVHSPV